MLQLIINGKNNSKENYDKNCFVHMQFGKQKYLNILEALKFLHSHNQGPNPSIITVFITSFNPKNDQ